MLVRKSVREPPHLLASHTGSGEEEDVGRCVNVVLRLKLTRKCKAIDPGIGNGKAKRVIDRWKFD